jgi:hypothetical protein
VVCDDDGAATQCIQASSSARCSRLSKRLYIGLYYSYIHQPAGWGGNRALVLVANKG